MFVNLYKFDGSNTKVAESDKGVFYFVPLGFWTPICTEQVRRADPHWTLPEDAEPTHSDSLVAFENRFLSRNATKGICGPCEICGDIVGFASARLCTNCWEFDTRIDLASQEALLTFLGKIVKKLRINKYPINPEIAQEVNRASSNHNYHDRSDLDSPAPLEIIRDQLVEGACYAQYLLTHRHQYRPDGFCEICGQDGNG
jgi:hypothetical protein